MTDTHARSCAHVCLSHLPQCALSCTFIRFHPHTSFPSVRYVINQQWAAWPTCDFTFIFLWQQRIIIITIICVCLLVKYIQHFSKWLLKFWAFRFVRFSCGQQKKKLCFLPNRYCQQLWPPTPAKILQPKIIDLLFLYTNVKTYSTDWTLLITETKELLRTAIVCLIGQHWTWAGNLAVALTVWKWFQHSYRHW